MHMTDADVVSKVTKIRRVFLILYYCLAFASYGLYTLITDTIITGWPLLFFSAIVVVSEMICWQIVGAILNVKLFNKKPQSRGFWLWGALVDNDHRSVEEYLKLGADPNDPHTSVRRKKNWTPLMYASGNCDAEMIELLIKYGADVNCQSVDGITPLTVAINKGKFGNMRVLETHGAKASVTPP